VIVMDYCCINLKQGLCTCNYRFLWYINGFACQKSGQSSIHVSNSEVRSAVVGWWYLWRQDITFVLSRVRMKGVMSVYMNSTFMMLDDFVCVESCVDIYSLVLIGVTQILRSVE